jgi:hypothetical protein
MLLLHLQRIGLVVSNARGVDHICHAALLLGRFVHRGEVRPSRDSGEIAIILGSYAIAAVCAIAAPVAAFGCSRIRNAPLQ